MLNVRIKCEQSKKPQFCATAVMERFLFFKSRQAFFTLSSERYSMGEVLQITANRLR